MIQFILLILFISFGSPPASAGDHASLPEGPGPARYFSIPGQLCGEGIPSLYQGPEAPVEKIRPGWLAEEPFRLQLQLNRGKPGQFFLVRPATSPFHANPLNRSP